VLDGRGSSSNGGTGRSGVEFPGQQFGNAVDRKVGDAVKDVAQIGFGIKAI
jgi:hypothetical protein